MHALNINDAACAYLLKLARPYQRTVALERCTAHLVEQHDCSQSTASLAAIQAIAELETLNQPAFIDADATTSHVVIVRRPGMKAMAFSVADLLRLHAQEKTLPAPTAGLQ
ncbi:hypothetical protein [Modicisalibacter radicis]|uniref:hypothetical protein n=1 Tax=Halomonas sp. EAR18 TaxID=2518972 RepID=UPI00109CF2D8|nr:hypothetical protein [Halomonas sp. EAR18]